jgi:adenine-specific DNA-methyltransferase
VFSGIQQEVVLLLCEKSVKDNEGIRVIEFENLKTWWILISLKSTINIKAKTIDHTSEKWTKYFKVDNKEINLLRRIKKGK